MYDSSACQAMCVAAVPAAHAGGVMSLALEDNAQGKLLLYSGSDAGDVRVWCHVPANSDDNHQSPPPGIAPLSCARQQFKVRGDGGAVKSLVVVKDRLYSAHQDRKLRVWKLRGSPTSSSSNKKNSKKKLLKGMWRRNRDGGGGDENDVQRSGDRDYEEADEHSAADTGLASDDDDSDDVAAARRRRSPRGGGGDHDDDGSSKPKKALATLPTFKDYVASFLPPSNYVRVRRHHKSLWIQHADTISVLVPGAGVLYSGSWDKSIKVWRLEDHKCLESLTAAHDDAINALVVDQANAFLYSGGADAKIKVWARILPDGSSIPATPYTTPYLFRPHQHHHGQEQQENASYASYNHHGEGASPSPAALGGAASPCPSDYQHHQQRASPLLRSRPSASNLLSPSLLFNRLQQQHIDYGRQQPPRKSSSYMSSPAPDMGGCGHHHQHHHHFKGTTPLHRVLHSSNQHGSHQLVATLEGHGSAINALALSPDGGLLYSASGDATISVWEREDSARHMTFATVLRGHLHAVLALAVSSSSSSTSSSSSGDETTSHVVCSGSADKTIRLWRRVSPTSLRHACVAVLSGHRGPVKSLALRDVEQVGTYLYSGGMDGDIRVWWLLLEHGQQQEQQVAAGHGYGHHGYREAHAPGNVVVVPSKSFPPSPFVLRTLCSNQQVV